MADKNLLIFGVLIIAVFLYLYNDKNKKEGFSPCERKNFTPYLNHISFDPDPSTKDIGHHLVDQMPCHESCCTKQPWAVPVDGMTSGEIKQCIRHGAGLNGGDFVTTPYRCSWGANGCPCVNQNSYKFLASRGYNNGRNTGRVEPTWVTPNKWVNAPDDDYYNHAEVNQSKKSYYSNSPTINDNEERRTGFDVKNITGFPGQSNKEKQLAQVSHGDGQLSGNIINGIGNFLNSTV
jgi:hypothetical protein